MAGRQLELSATSCQKCGGRHIDVVDSRPTDNRTAIRRRRSCQSCGHRWTTFERDDHEASTSRAAIDLAVRVDALPYGDRMLVLALLNRCEGNSAASHESARKAIAGEVGAWNA